MKFKRGEAYLLKTEYGERVGVYMGRQEGWTCSICGKGNNAYTFNFHYGPGGQYETLGYGKEHLPEVIKVVSDYLYK